ncbi:unnamed protein product [Arctia plantaginis]|uniref:Uncharacterized protein n=1 Tax=Arctia plantaginis TaxID=874455 RepID=A0A8S0ZSF9_ARCPL|nr:unnamed protein product [Arctia plantaginis]CAB3234975.1 unnamed protein product [Arctia plantaginis]
MASKLIVLLSLAVLGCVFAAPASTTEKEEKTTTATEDDLLVIDEIVVKEVPIVVALIDPTIPSEPETKETTSQPEHKVVKRSALRGDNPSNDLLANLDGLQFDNGLSEFGGRRIKFLPTWAG